MDILIKAAQLLLSLSILVIIHEFGHFTFARIFKTRVEKFYLFFNPWFSLYKKKIKDTVWGIGWLPLGGFVKISGMIDESMDTEQMKKPAQPWEFRSKTAWQRFLIMFGGVLFNFILAVLLFIGILTVFGERYLPTSSLKDGLWFTSEYAHEIGFRNGDVIVSIDGKLPESYESLIEELVYGTNVLVNRNGKDTTIIFTSEIRSELIGGEKFKGLVYPRMPFVIAQVPDSSLNENSGLRPKDHVLSVNGEDIRYFDKFKSISQSFAGQEVTMKIERDGETLNLPIKISEKGQMEVIAAIYDFDSFEKQGVYEFKRKDFNFFQAVPAGMLKAKNELVRYVRQFTLIFDFSTGAYKQMGGFIAIGSLFPPEWNWEHFWYMTALLSVVLGVMNILPIPALDGGHIMFLIYEMVARRKPGEKFMERAQLVGMAILFTLLILVNGNDVLKLTKEFVFLF